ncbi:MAG TPA: putative Ig domain-containing protein, partial [Kineosporiaceae bacterium]|nr:putative Ig domain-containing protein [Kineosporiaceae bacterium]
SNLNLVAGQTAAVLAVATVGANGKVSIYNSAGSTQIVADVQGWFTAGGDFVPLTPTRVLDTRDLGYSPVGAGLSVPVPTTSIPANASAVYLSVTAVWPSTSTYLTAYNSGAVPKASNVNADAGQVVPNLVVADARTALFIYNSAGSTHVLVDLLGYSSAPSMSGTASATGTVGTPFSFQVTAKGGVGALTWSVLPGAGSLPPGLTLDPASGLISGTPTQGGTYTFTAEATDTIGQTLDIAVTVTISLTVTPTAQGAAEVGVAYSLAPSVIGGTPPYRWTVTAGTLPAGLALDPATGVISGTPTAAVTATLTLQVLDAHGATGSQIGPFTVYPHLPHGVFAWAGAITHVTDHLAGPALPGPAPVQVAGLGDLVSMAASWGGGYGLKSDGTVWSWGTGGQGQLGDGTMMTFTSDPVQVSGLNGVLAVGATSGNGFAVKADGTVWGWGAGGPLLGQTTFSNTSVPVQIPGLDSVVAVSGGMGTAFALKSDGTVWAWGSGVAGILGNGTAPMYQPTPVQVSGLPKITLVRASRGTAYALGVDGTVWAWGLGNLGQFGNGQAPATAVLVPVQVTITGVKSISTGAFTGYALKSDGTVWAWGHGTAGELGNGGVSNSAVPVQVSGLAGITSIAGSGSDGYALSSDPDPRVVRCGCGFLDRWWCSGLVSGFGQGGCPAVASGGRGSTFPGLSWVGGLIWWSACG